jgi:N-acetylneuraminic acid mutarotase
VPATGDLAYISLGSVNNMPNEGYVTIINDMSAGAGSIEISSADLAWVSEHDPIQGWEVSQSMLESRYQADALALISNKGVLVVGGGESTTSHTFIEAERYDPSTETWNVTSPSLPKNGAMIATIANGKVLATGGFNISTATLTGQIGCTSAEVYDPLSDSWTVVAPMSLQRRFHTLSSMQNGTALAVGGAVLFTAISNCETYDPATNAWSSVASLNDARIQHAAITLQDGRVLVVGGTTDGITEPSNLFEIYTLGGIWAASGSFIGHVNTALGGVYANRTPILVPLQNGKVLAIGVRITSSLSDVAIFDPQTNLMTQARQPNFPVGQQAVTLTSGKVLMTGGTTSGDVGTISEVYDPTTDTWEQVGSLNVPRSGAPMVVLQDGTAMILGSGYPNGFFANGSTDGKSTELFVTIQEDPSVFVDGVLESSLPDANIENQNTIFVSDFDDTPIDASALVVGTGTVTSNNTTTLNAGSTPTAFVSQVHVGDFILVAGLTYFVTFVTNNSSLTTMLPIPTMTNVEYSIIKNIHIVGVGTVSSDGSSYSITADTPTALLTPAEPNGPAKNDYIVVAGNAYSIEAVAALSSSLSVTPQPPAFSNESFYIVTQDAFLKATTPRGDFTPMLSSITIGSTVKLSADSDSRFGIYGVTAISPRSAGFVFGLSFITGTGTNFFIRKEPIHFALINEVLGPPVMSSLFSSDNPIFRINNSNDSTILPNPPDTTFGLGTNVEMMFYSGIDCDNARLLNVRRACNGTTATRHAPQDIVFKGMASIQVSPSMISGSTGVNFEGMECFLRSDGSVKLKVLDNENGSFVDDTVVAYASYQGIFTQTLEPIRPFDPNDVDDDCLVDVSPIPPCSVSFEIPPAITSALTLFAYVGDAISYQITASGSPLDFSASALPTGLAVDTNTGIISGTILSVIVQDSVIGASNEFGGDTKILTTTTVTRPPPPAPVVFSYAAQGILFFDYNLGVLVRGDFYTNLSATSNPTSWGATGLPSGVSIDTSTGIISGSPTIYGQSQVSITATNSGGTGSGTVLISISPFANRTRLLSISVGTDSAQALIEGLGYGEEDPNFVYNGGSYTRPFFSQFYSINGDPMAVGQIPELNYPSLSYTWSLPQSGLVYPAVTQYMQKFVYGRSDAAPQGSGQPWPVNGFVGAIVKMTLNDDGDFAHSPTTCSEQFLVVANTVCTMDLVPIPGTATTRIPRKILGPRGARVDINAWHDGETGWTSDTSVVSNWVVEVWGPDWTSPYTI